MRRVSSVTAWITFVEKNRPLNSEKRFTITALPMWIPSWHKLIAWSTHGGFPQQGEFGKESKNFIFSNMPLWEWASICSFSLRRGKYWNYRNWSLTLVGCIFTESVNIGYKARRALKQKKGNFLLKYVDTFIFSPWTRCSWGWSIINLNTINFLCCYFLQGPSWPKWLVPTSPTFKVKSISVSIIET